MAGRTGDHDSTVVGRQVGERRIGIGRGRSGLQSGKLVERVGQSRGRGRPSNEQHALGGADEPDLRALAGAAIEQGSRERDAALKGLGARGVFLKVEDDPDPPAPADRGIADNRAIRAGGGFPCDAARRVALLIFAQGEHVVARA